MRFATISPRERALAALQIRVLAALILREMRATFGTSHLGYLWAVITPIASIMILTVIFSYAARHPPFGSSLALFFATGIIVLQLVLRLAESLMTAPEANHALLAYPPIKRTDVLLSRAILIVLTYLVIALTIHGGLTILGLAALPAHPEEILLAYASASLLGTGLGMINAVLLSHWDSWRRIVPILTKPLFFISGVFFVPDYLPPQIMEWLHWNPVLHAIEWTRDGYYADYQSQTLDKSYLLGTSLFLLFAGLVAERLTRRSGAV
jgi:capsular polysaccharide transport system permease protein